jgi:ATP-binding cassette subfamily F protein 3
MISPKDRIGLIGRNGAGKSTLLKIIAAQSRPDSGAVEFPLKTTIGYLRQEFELNENRSVRDEAMSCHEEAVALQRQLDELNAEIALREDYESDSYHRLLEDLASITGQLEHFNLSTLEVETIRILKGLGFTDADLPRQVAEFSGGWKMRIELAKLLLRNPDILMLDEPTNHLDIESIIWLEGYLTTYPGTVIVISHDIQFLENVCNRILEIEWGQISDYRMGYKRFLEEKEKQQSVRLSAYENQQRDIAQKEKTINRFMAKATKTKMAQSMQKQLDKVERIEIPLEQGKTMTIRFAEVPRSGRDAVRTIGLSRSFDAKTVFSNVDITIERGDRVAFVGQNGQGKTTMAKIIAGVLPPSSGKVETGSNLHMSYYAQNQSELLDLKKTVLEVMEDKAPEEMRTKVRSILGAFLFSGDDADKKVSVLSGGERARLAMASLIMRPCNFLILDEPTNHLDIYSKEVLKLALAEYQGTLLVISHDREFLEGLTSKVIEFRSGSTREFLGDINYFLERRKLQDMRAIEESGSRKVDESTQASSKPEGEELRRMRKLVQQAEREIAKLEQEIALIEVKLSDPDFYAAPEFVDTNKKYAELQDQLIGKMEEWEALLTRLEG